MTSNTPPAIDYPIASFVARLQRNGSTNTTIDYSKVEMLLSILSDREKHIVRLRHGLGPWRPHTLAEIADAVGLSRSRIVQIETKAFRRIAWLARDHPDDQALSKYLAARAVVVLVQEQKRERDAAARTHEIEQKRLAKAERHEIRRAKARLSAWRRKLRSAENERQALTTRATMLQARMTRMERRGWLGRTILRHRSKLARMTQEAELLAHAIHAAGEVVATIRNSPPD